MPNPTSAKPTTNFAEWLNSGIGASTRLACPLLASGSPRDVVGNVLGVPWLGVNGHGTGHAPQLVAGAFTPAGQGASPAYGDPAYWFGPGTTALRFPGRGFTSITYPNVTRFLFKPMHAGALLQARTIALSAMGTVNATWGIGIQISTAGVITLGRSYSTGFTSAGITLTSGKWYLVSMTHPASTTILWNVYCYDDQAYVTPSTTGTLITGAGVPIAGTDLVVNPGINYEGQVYESFAGYIAGFSTSSTATDDPATNGNFAALIADPYAESRGTVTSSGTALTAGGIACYDETTTAIEVHSNRASGGVAGTDSNSYSYYLHRQPIGLAGFTPSAGTRIAGPSSSPRWQDATAVAGQGYAYAVEATDGTTTVYSTTATSNAVQVHGRLSRGDFLPLIAGDSRLSASTGLAAPQAMMRLLRAAGWRCGMANMAVPSSAVSIPGNVSLSWQPPLSGPYSDPTNGQANTVPLAAALQVGAIRGCNYFLCNLGVGDCGQSTSAATYKTKYGYILTQVATTAMTALLDAPYLDLTNTLAQIALIPQYQAQLASLDNGSTVRYLGTNAFDLSSTGMEALALDYLHVTDAQIPGLAAGMAVLKAIDPTNPMLGFGGGVPRIGKAFIS